jgi:pimeloyl-ACP methyl ester carboxylesterase
MVHKSGRRTYVLIHGAWHGAWVWKDVAPALREMGHTVTTPTLTGLGERRQSRKPGINLDTHTEDILEHIEMEGLDKIVLVGWSYGGMVASEVLARTPQKIASMVYLDAFLPERGKALVDYAGPVAANSDLEPIPLEVFGVTDQAVIDYVTPRLTLQPIATFTQPSKALEKRPANIPHTYVFATGFDPSPFKQFLEKVKGDPQFDTHVMQTSHLTMLTDPVGTTNILANAK